MDADSRPSVLVLRALKLGDLLVAVPALKGLRAAFSEHRLLLAAPAWLEPVVKLVGSVDALVPLPGLEAALPGGFDGVDVAVNLHGQGPQSCALLEALHPHQRIGHASPGWDGVPWRSELHERERWARMLRWHGIAVDSTDISIMVPPGPPPLKGASVIHVGASQGSRQWPVERFAAVARELENCGHSVVVTGDRADAVRSRAVARLARLRPAQDLGGRLGLSEFAAVIAAARVVISADTGAAHLASAYGTPSVVLFGPASPAQWGPPPGPHRVLTDQQRSLGNAYSAVPDPALLAVQPQQVLRAAAEVTRNR